MVLGSEYIPSRFENWITITNIKKYDWIEIDLKRNTSDFRPESYRPESLDKPPKIVGHIGTENCWQLRKEIVLRNVYKDLQ
jgi:hypothetical protein